MIKLEQEVIVIAYAIDVELLRSQAKAGFESIDGRQISQNDRVVVRVLAAPLAFIIAKEKGAVFLNWTAQGKAELVLPQLIQSRSCQDAVSIHGIVAEVFVDTAMHFVGAALGDDVDDASDRATSLYAVGVVDNQELPYSFL